MSEHRSASGHDLTPLEESERQRLASDLDSEERRVLLNQGTEPPFCGGMEDSGQSGTYHCRLCHLPLFSSAAKFESGTGWPSFHSGYDPEHIREITDNSLGMTRTEIRCARCDGHLGHVFPDGPPASGLRYCLNSVSLTFVPDDQ